MPDSHNVVDETYPTVASELDGFYGQRGEAPSCSSTGTQILPARLNLIARPRTDNEAGLPSCCAVGVGLQPDQITMR
jgi:hypothetical protein